MSFRDDFEKIIDPIQLNQNMPKEDFNARALPLIQFIQAHGEHPKVCVNLLCGVE